MVHPGWCLMSDFSAVCVAAAGRSGNERTTGAALETPDRKVGSCFGWHIESEFGTQTGSCGTDLLQKKKKNTHTHKKKTEKKNTNQKKKKNS